MPDPLPPKSVYASNFAKYVQKHTDAIYALSFLLLGQSEPAEQVTIQTFTELYKLSRQADFCPHLFSSEAYRSCIRRCSELMIARSIWSAEELSWDDQILRILWYGMRLPLPEISIILQKSVPALKAQLRQMREQMNAQGSILPDAKLPAM